MGVSMSGYLKNFAFAAIVLVALPAPTAWAADTKTYAVLHASEPAIPDGQGRIYFYRESGIMGLTLRPAIYIDGVGTGGHSIPGDYFYIDRPAGDHLVNTRTEKKESVSVTVVAGQAIYVKTSVSMGFLIGHVIPEVVPASVAEKEIKDCDYEGPQTLPATASTPAAPAASEPAPAPAAQPAPATTP